MVEIAFAWKLIIFFVILVIAYFVLRHYEQDPLVIISEAISNIEWNMVALVVTLLISLLIWAIIWKTPWWQGECIRFLCVTGIPAKIFLTIMTPITGYPLAVRALNR